MILAAFHSDGKGGLSQTSGVVPGFAVGTRIAASALQFALVFALGRTLGDAGVGRYYLFVYWADILGVAAGLGSPSYVLKHVSVAPAGSSWIRNVIFGGAALTFGGWLLLSAALALASGHLSLLPFRADQIVPVLISCLALGLVRINAEALKALHRTTLALSLEYALVPATVLLAVLFMWLTGTRIAVSQVLWIHIAGQIASLIAATMVIHSLRKDGEPASKQPIPKHGFAIRDAALETTSYWGVLLINSAVAAAPYMVLHYWAEAGEIGRFAAAHRLVGVAATIQTALAAVFSPQFSRLHAESSTEDLRRTFRLSQCYSLLAYLPLFAAYVFTPNFLLDLLGEGFAQGASILTTLATGRLVSSAFGLTENYLSMTGRARSELLNALCCLLSFFSLVAAPAREWGAWGVALAWAVMVSLRSTVGLIMVIRSQARVEE
jgi:O-antigen/teichoic acid export membrane protein